MQWWTVSLLRSLGLVDSGGRQRGCGLGVGCGCQHTEAMGQRQVPERAAARGRGHGSGSSDGAGGQEPLRAACELGRDTVTATALQGSARAGRRRQNRNKPKHSRECPPEGPG